MGRSVRFWTLGAADGRGNELPSPLCSQSATYGVSAFLRSYGDDGNHNVHMAGIRFDSIIRTLMQEEKAG
jgi:hypothetical protein